MKKKISLEYQLGYYVGEFIYSNFLPTLSTDLLKSRNVINVSDEDASENTRLESLWSFCSKSNDNNTKKKWKAYHAHNVMLHEKYLPHNLKCHIPKINVEDIEEFKSGLINSLGIAIFVFTV